MSNNRILNFSVLEEEIKPNNVISISELLAFLQTRFLISYIAFLCFMSAYRSAYIFCMGIILM